MYRCQFYSTFSYFCFILQFLEVADISLFCREPNTRPATDPVLYERGHRLRGRPHLDQQGSPLNPHLDHQGRPVSPHLDQQGRPLNPHMDHQGRL